LLGNKGKIMSKSQNYIFKSLFFCLIFLLTFPHFSLAASDKSHSQTSHSKEEKIKPGEIIIDHVINHHSWHICTIKDKPVSVPLPVILHSRDRGWFFFMSDKFNHGHDTYKNFKILHEGKNKGMIVELDGQGNIKEEKPLDLSITKVVAGGMFAAILMIIVFISIARSYKRSPNKPPKGLQSLLEPIIVFIRDDVARSNIGEEKYEKFTPFLLSIFFFIFLNNLLGLIPIFPAGANVTGNITVTMTLALFTFLVTIISGNKHYWTEIVNPPAVPWWLKIPIPLVPIIEIMGIFTKPFVLMIRLFANISAGHIVALGFLTLIFIFGSINPIIGYGVSVVSVAFTIFLTLLELLVAFIQAYVFTILSAIYFGMAVGEE